MTPALRERQVRLVVRLEAWPWDWRGRRNAIFYSSLEHQVPR